jgi:hypothetical protein
MSLHGDMVIGLSLPNTGRYAPKAGVVYERAYNLWLNEINERGGLLGKRVRFLVYDDGSTPEKAAENYRGRRASWRSFTRTRSGLRRTSSRWKEQSLPRRQRL